MVFFVYATIWSTTEDFCLFRVSCRFAISWFIAVINSVHDTNLFLTMLLMTTFSWLLYFGKVLPVCSTAAGKSIHITWEKRGWFLFSSRLAKHIKFRSKRMPKESSHPLSQPDWQRTKPLKKLEERAWRSGLGVCLSRRTSMSRIQSVLDSSRWRQWYQQRR